MAEAPQEPQVATQKRPLEEPSSPSGPTDQPEAKRPALDKIIREDDATAAEADDELPVEQPAASSDAEPDQATRDPTEPATAAEQVTTDKQGDTVVPDVPTNGEAADSTNPALPSNSPGTIVAAAVEFGGDAPPAANQPQDETSWLHVRSIITTTEAATIIGKNGENVTQIRKMAGSKCTVSEYVRGAVERILTVSGPVDAVAKAFGLIIRTLNQEPLDQPSTPQSKTYPLRLLIPHILIGSIIGKGGVNIREVQDASGARLNVSEMCLAPSTERSLVILGVADAVHIATYYVGRTLVQQLKERFGGPAASNYAGRHGGPQGVVPGGMQVVPYNPQHAGGQMGHPDNYRKNAVPPQRAPVNVHGYGAPYMHPQAPQPQTHAPMHYGGAGTPRAPYVGAGPQQAQPYGHAGPALGHAGPPQQPPMGAMGPGQPITQQIFIPNDMVGAIIGKGGQKINEIRQLSGSIIKINEPQDNNNERLVTVTGTSECNQMALYMLYSRLGLPWKQ